MKTRDYFEKHKNIKSTVDTYKPPASTTHRYFNDPKISWNSYNPSTESIINNDKYWPSKFDSRPTPSKSARGESLSKRSIRRGFSNAKGTLMNKAGSTLKSIPSPITKGKSILSKLGLGAVAMLNMSVMKSIGKQSVNMFERFMQDGAVGRNILNAGRVGGKVALGVGAGVATVGLANALSANRHGRG